jgi:ABC-2 type transport system ATP-binding protein
MSEPVIWTERLSKSYGRRRGLDGLDLEVRAGEVFGYLGPNGAGKTTTIRLLLDLIRPSGGEIRVLGVSPRAGGPALRRRIGYLPGDFSVDGRQSVCGALTYLGNLRGGIPGDQVEELAGRLELELGARVASLSKGNRQKIGLVQAFMHTPELLILDEPTSGLDPLVQQQFLAMVRQARQRGQTVFMSSHILSEVQHVADRVGVIRAGRLVAVEGVEALRERALRRVEIRFAAPVAGEEFVRVPGVHDLTVEGTVLRCRLAGSPDGLLKAAARHTVVDLLSQEPDLEELFLAYYDTGEGSRAA